MFRSSNTVVTLVKLGYNYEEFWVTYININSRYPQPSLRGVVLLRDNESNAPIGFKATDVQYYEHMKHAITGCWLLLY